MKNSQLILLLKKFTSRELNKLENMLASPYFNRNPLLLQLYDMINESILQREGDLDKKLVFRSLFPDKKRFDTSLSVLMSKLLDLAEQTLVLEQLRLRPHTRDYLLMKGLGEKGDGKNIKKIGATNLKKLKNKQRPTKEDYYHRYLFTNLLYELQVTTFSSKEQRPEEVVAKLDAFYLSHRLPLTYEMMNLQRVMSVNYHQVSTDKVLDLSETVDLDQFHLIKLYHQSVLLMKELENEDHFQRYLEYLAHLGGMVSKEELHSLYTIAQNYCIPKIIQGKSEFYSNLFKIYTIMIDQKVLFITKYIPAGLVKNVVTLSCQIGEYDWAHTFLKEYSYFLEPDTRKLTSKYYEATIFFYEGEYEKAQVLMSQIESREVIFELGRRFVLLKIYYELKEEEALYNLLHAFDNYIRNNKSIATNVKRSYLNFSKILKQLAKIWPEPTPSKAKKIREKLTGYEQVSGRKWLLDKLEEFLRL